MKISLISSFDNVRIISCLTGFMYDEIELFIDADADKKSIDSINSYLKSLYPSMQVQPIKMEKILEILQQKREHGNENLVFVGAISFLQNLLEYLLPQKKDIFAFEDEMVLILEEKNTSSWNLVEMFHFSSIEGIKNNPLNMFYNMILEFTDDLIYIKDTQYKFSLVNQKFAHEFGYDNWYDVVQKTDYDFFSKELADIYREDDRRILENGCSIVDKIESYKKSNHVDGWLKTTKRPIKDAFGNIIGILGFSVDITSLIQAEKEIMKQKKEFETFFQTTNDSIIIVDKQANILFFNDTFMKTLGYPKNELLHMSLCDITENETYLEKDNDFRKVLQEEYVKNIEKKIITKDRKILEMNFSVASMPDHKRFIISARDMTEAKKKENLLYEYMKIIDEYVITSTSDMQVRITDVSSAFCKISGYQREELIGKFHNFLEHEDMAEETKKEIEDSIAKSKVWHGEVKNRRKDGTTYWLSAIISPMFDMQGNKTGYTSISQDITDKKLLEQKKQEQESVLKNLEKFIDNQDNIVVLASEDDIFFANKKFFDFFGYQDISSFKKHNCFITECFIQNDRFFYLRKDHKKSTWITAIQKLPPSRRIVLMQKKSGKEHMFSVNISKFDEKLFIVSFSDITQTMAEQFVLEEKNLHDNLTNAYNREYFNLNYGGLITTFLKQGYKVGLAMLDIDKFKRVNDNYGHDVGDVVLIQFVSIIMKHIRKEDLFVRWGGEEFIMILKANSVEDLISALEKIRKEIEKENFSIVGKITCSIGGTIYQKEEEIEKVIKRADENLYIAKKSGRNRVIVQ